MKNIQMELSQDTEQVGNKIKTRQTQSVTIHLNKHPRLLDSVGEGKGGMHWENHIEPSILSRVK